MSKNDEQQQRLAKKIDSIFDELATMHEQLGREVAKAVLHIHRSARYVYDKCVEHVCPLHRKRRGLIPSVQWQRK